MVERVQRDMFAVGPVEIKLGVPAPSRLRTFMRGLSAVVL
jgi:hypothetical protein